MIEKLKEIINKALIKCDISINLDDIMVEIPKDTKNGDYSSNIAMKLAKVLKENPINIWSIDTNILYGAKDELCEFETIYDFVKKYDCGLEVMDTGEHYFHTEEQLNVLKNWIKKHID